VTRLRGSAIWLRAALCACAAAAVLATYLQATGAARAREAASRHRPVEQQGDGYVSSRECRACHLEHHASWSASYHRTMTKPATPEYVFGDFGAGELEHDGLRVALREEHGRFYMDEREIVLVTGSHHMQVYWYETGRARELGQVPFIYLKPEQRWIPRTMAFLRAPGKLRPAETGRWNTACITCHATHGQPRIGRDASLDTRVAEFGIACEACHGPGRAHVQRHRSPMTRYAAHASGGGDDSIVNPGRLPHDRASQICGQCHAMWQFESAAAQQHWAQRGFAYRPGDETDPTRWLFSVSHAARDKRIAEVVRDNPDYAFGQFWPDGQARVSGREYHGVADSPCFERGELSCLSCHGMHQAADDTRTRAAWADDQLHPGHDGDRACLQCHDELASKLAEHTRHAPTSAGSLCYNCHMPYTSYGLLKAIRSHEITVPTVAETVATGRPNACNLCHLDKSLGWTARALQARGGSAPAAPELSSEQQTIAASVLHATRGDAGQRALIAWALGWEPARRASGEHWIAPYLGMLLDDPYDAVRFIAERSLRSLPGYDRELARLRYDFVHAPGSRPPVAQEIARIAAARVPARANNAAVLLGPSGALDAETLARLLAQRDRRPVTLLE
jgi:hypothetical protein